MEEEGRCPPAAWLQVSHANTLGAGQYEYFAILALNNVNTCVKVWTQ